MNYPKSFIVTITKTYGVAGKKWLDELPTLIDSVAHKWQLSDLKPYENLTYNYVLSGIQGTMPIVLKLRSNQKELQEGINALQAFKDHGSVALIGYDVSSRALLLAQARPGTPLTALFPQDDRKATNIALQLMLQLHQAPRVITFAHLHEIIPVFDTVFVELAPFIDHARMIKERVLCAAQSDVLLHGDFHSENILLNGNEYQVIDPQGMIGNPLYDVAVYIRNPMRLLVEHPACKQIIMQRIDDCAQILPYTKEEIYEWTYLQTFISAYWSLKDGLDISNYITMLTVLRDINTDL